MQKVHDIPVLHDIALALGSQLASLACLARAAQRNIIAKSDGFGADEALLEIAVDLARRLGRGRALVDGPRARLLRPDGKEGQQVEQLVSGADHARQPGFVQPHLLQEQHPLVGLQAHQLARSEEHTSELQSLMRSSYAVFCLKKKNKTI